MARTRTVLLRFATAAAALALFTGTGLAAEGDVTQVASGLDNPRHLSFGINGALYVAEAGRGGAGPCIPNPEGGGDVCYGATGAITLIQGGAQSRVVTGLPSSAGADGSAATGPHDVAVTWYGTIFSTIGLGANPSLTAPGGVFEGLGFGTLMQFGWDGNRVLSDLAAYEALANPDGDDPDSNPYGLFRTWEGMYVADAGGNSLVRLDAETDELETVAVFPDLTPAGATNPVDAVPTSVAMGPDDSLYVGQLTGFPYPPGAASVVRIDPDDTLTEVASGFTNIVDIEFGPFGSLYVVELSSAGLLSGDLNGALVRVDPDGTRTSVPLFAPGGVAVDWTGEVYATVCSVCAGGGAVVKVEI